MVATIQGTKAVRTKLKLIPFLFLDELIYNLIGTDEHKMVVKDRDSFLAGECTPMVFKDTGIYVGVDAHYVASLWLKVSLLRPVGKFEKAIMKPFYRNREMPTHAELSTASAYGRLRSALKKRPDNA